ncbi:hypothetical protein [Granulicella tundricola]|uniref:HEAT domain containing protein n=1 Tax=Granulicella tundricola (strain ATCC BAA-1859 / DSM 23138 / MP5ACTX9) TaxID=1198114 RepID=E8WWZ6_GRATM|nr:hypothetical protein [Granulicella tundricola]ADW68557.1 hypothetical protein AciX9_1504 [Granulicella tundricola MP5ACTX9]
MKLLTILLAAATLASAQEAPKPGPLAWSFAELLSRSSNGHSPTQDEIAAAGQVTANAAALREALPLILKALENPDEPVRAYALTTLVSLEAPADPATPAAPIAYKSEFQKILTPAIPKIAAHLTDESQGDRILTAAILGGFSPDPPASIYPPLFAYLKRDDGVGTVGQAVVEDILQLGPIHDDAAAAIISYLHRPDQTSDSRSNLVEAIATHPFQSQSVNKVLLGYLDSDDPSLRARLILSLPQLDLAPDVFTETRERVTQLTANDQESLAVVNAAKSVATCWTAVKMASGCPVY